MPSSKAYRDFVLDQLAGLPEVTTRAMMGEYILYVRGKMVGGLYDDRLLVKPTAHARALMPDAAEELPYEGAKPMLLVDRVDEADFLTTLMNVLADDLPEPKRK